jgi:adenylyl cyclase-associated protein
MAGLLAPTKKAVEDVVNYFESHRASKQINHLQAIKEMVPCLGWVTIAPKPAVYVKQAMDAATFYTNRVLKAAQGDDEKKWTRTATGLLKDLQEYVKSYHTTGLTWNPEGGDATAVAKPASSSGPPPPPPPAGGAPPPPPPPAVVPPSESSDGGVKVAQANLFAEINQKGGGITSGLKKVTNDMKTYKNPELRASSVVKAGEVKKTESKPARSSAPAAKKPPVCTLQGKRWLVEYQENNPNLVISDTNKSQTVYAYKCTKCTIKVEGKINAIILDNCKRVAVVFDSVIGTCEFVNCQSIQAQVLGVVPTISVDKTDGCQVFLSKDSLQCEFITAKSSEMNISVPKGDEGDFSEFAIPEQFRTRYNGKTLVTECTDING